MKSSREHNTDKEKSYIESCRDFTSTCTLGSLFFMVSVICEEIKLLSLEIKARPGELTIFEMKA